MGKKGTVDLSKGVYYLEDDDQIQGMRQLMEQLKTGVLASIPTAGPSWRPEVKGNYVPHAILDRKSGITTGESMIGATDDGSVDIMSAFCQSCITGEKATNVVEEAYSATLLCLLANQAMDEHRVITFPEEYKIPYMRF